MKYGSFLFMKVTVFRKLPKFAGEEGAGMKRGDWEMTRHAGRHPELPPLIKFVLAGSENQFTDYCQTVQMDQSHPAAVLMFVDSVSTLLKVRKMIDEVVLVGDYKNNPAFNYAKKNGYLEYLSIDSLERLYEKPTGRPLNPGQVSPHRERYEDTRG